MKNNNIKITFKELADRGRKILDSQKPISLDKAKLQVKFLKDSSKSLLRKLQG